MRRFIKWDKKYLYYGITAFCVIAASIVFFMLLKYIGFLGKGISTLVRILSPFIWGLVITYLFNPFMVRTEKNLFLPLTEKLYRKSKKTGKGMARALSVLLCEIVLLAIIVALIYLIIPQLYSSIETIVQNGDKYINDLSSWVQATLADYPDIEGYVMAALDSTRDSLMEWLRTTLLPELGSLVTNVTSGVVYTFKTIYNLIIGIIVSIYLLGNVEGFCAGSKRFMYSIFSVDTCQKIREALLFADKTFMGFISGKLLDSAIIGLICYIFCAVAEMPYALLVSVIVGVTNIIPFFGPFIGAIPSALIILLVSPIKCLVFIVFIFVLQQIDGNFIGPKILGSTTGISGFWVMFSIILGAGLFGFWGMLLGVPVFVVIYTAVNNSIEKRLRRNGLPIEAEEYGRLDYIDPVTHEPVRSITESNDKTVK
ncbi:MAG: AI-2E family transporter [Eubacteriales bacterium]|nr:AI-2E family transporter [Eubacteriales bacterium]